MRFRLRFIASIFLLAVMAPLGCSPTNKGEQMLVRKLNAVILTATDLPTMEEDSGRRIDGEIDQPPVIDGYIQYWDGSQPEEHLYVYYWLFGSVADAREAADKWRGLISARMVKVNGKWVHAYQREPTAAGVIGDGTWRVENHASIWFVKKNVLVYIIAQRPKVNQLPFTRSVGRKIEAKINAVLNRL